MPGAPCPRWRRLAKRTLWRARDGSEMKRHIPVAVGATLLITALCGSVEAKTFRWANDGDANSMDPYARQETFLLLFDMSFYEPLVRRDRAMKLAPGLAT